MSELNLSKKEMERIAEQVSSIMGKLWRDERKWDVVAYYSTSTPAEASSYNIVSNTASLLVDEFFTNEDTENLLRIIIEVSPKFEESTDSK